MELEVHHLLGWALEMAKGQKYKGTDFWIPRYKGRPQILKVNKGVETGGICAWALGGQLQGARLTGRRSKRRPKNIKVRRRLFWTAARRSLPSTGLLAKSIKVLNLEHGGCRLAADPPGDWPRPTGAPSARTGRVSTPTCPKLQITCCRPCLGLRSTARC